MSDAEIIALLGDDDVPGDRSRIERHLGECSRCAARVAVIRSRWNGFVELLSETEPVISRDRLPGTFAEVQRARWLRRRQGQLRWTAGIILLLGVVFVTPVRAWITSWVTQQWAGVTGSSGTGDPPVVPEPAPTVTPPQTRHGLQFRPAGDEFTLIFAAPQRQGTVTVWVGESPDAYIEVANQAGADPIVVFPTSLRVRNAPTSRGSYKLVLSPGVRLFRLQVGGAAVAEIPTHRLGSGGQTLELREQ